MYWSEGILSGRENLLDVCIDRQLRMLIARYVWRAIILAWKKREKIVQFSLPFEPNIVIFGVFEESVN